MGLNRRQCAKAAAAANRIEVLQRIKRSEKAIAEGSEYLETGKHATRHGFRQWFVRRSRDGKELPPHKDWVHNVYFPRLE